MLRCLWDDPRAVSNCLYGVGDEGIISILSVCLYNDSKYIMRAL